MPEMIYRTLGKTGLDVSILSFGAATLGNAYGDVDDTAANKAVHDAIDAGINYFDTSPLYGDTLSETRLGGALKGRRDEVVLSTKGGHYPDHFDFSAEGLRRSLEDSLRRLQTDYVDIFLLHDIEFEDQEIILNEALPEVFRLRDAGKVRFVGVSGYPLRPLQQVAEIHPIDVILSYSHYTLLNTTLMHSLADAAQEKNIGLINASPLDMGLLTDEGPPAWHKVPEDIRSAVKDAAAVAHQHHTRLAHVALQFALQNNRVATTLVGMRTAGEVQQNVDLIHRALSNDVLESIHNVFRPFKDYQRTIGLPENQDR